jgi:hypothetical protein
MPEPKVIVGAPDVVGKVMVVLLLLLMMLLLLLLAIMMMVDTMIES